MKIPKPILRAGLASLRRVFESERVPMSVQRRTVDAISGASAAPAGTVYTSAVIAGVPCEVVRPPGARPGSVMVFSHGGGYAMGSARGYRSLAAHLAAAGGTTAVVPDYRLAPEHQCPAALDDIIAVYRAVTQDGAPGPGGDSGEVDEVIIAGDSAGGGLTLALAQTIRDTAMHPPMAVVLISPWLDLAADAAGTRPPGRDPLITTRLTSMWCRPYIGALASTDPRLSPLYGGLTELPPIIMHSAGDDPLRHDAIALEAAYRQAPTGSGPLMHRLYPRLWHDFHLQVGFLPEADAAIADLGARLHSLRTSPTDLTRRPT